MILYFRSADLHYAKSAAFCTQLRRQNELVCFPDSDEDPAPLAELPFTAVIMHYDRCPDGLPHPDALKQCFPTLPLIAFGSVASDTGRWRTIPKANYELTELAVLSTLIDRLRREKHHSPLRRTGLLLPKDRRQAIVLIRRVAFSPNEYTLLRVLNAAPNPLSAAMLAAFIARPGDRHPTHAIALHICNLNKKATSAGAPRLVGCRRGCGYLLLPPFNQVLPEEALHILRQRGQAIGEGM